MTCSLISDANFIDPNSVNVQEPSSERTNFEASNLVDRQQRSKVWRSDGYYTISSSNNTIVFRETIATDLTATLTEGVYSSASALAVEIKTQLEAVGGSVYTIAINSTTSKWTLTSDGAGGGGIFELILTDVSSAGLAAILGFSTASDRTGDLSYEADTINLHTEEFILWDLGLPSLPTGFALLGDRNAPVALSPGASIKLQGNHTDNFSTAVFEQVITYDDNGLFHFDDTGFGTVYLRYWKAQVIDPGNANGYIQLGYAYLGSTIKPTRGAVRFPFVGSQDDFSDTVTVVGGQVYGNNRARSDEFTLEWALLTTAEKEDFDLHFKNKGLSFPFLVYLDENIAFSSSQSYWLRLVRYASRPQYSLVSPNNWSVRMVVREAL